MATALLLLASLSATDPVSVVALFRELEAILRGGSTQPQSALDARNMTVLSVVKPLIQFVRKRPNFTLKTRRLSESSRAVLQTLRSTQEPDDLLNRRC